MMSYWACLNRNKHRVAWEENMALHGFNSPFFRMLLATPSAKISTDQRSFSTSSRAQNPADRVTSIRWLVQKGLLRAKVAAALASATRKLLDDKGL